MTDAQRQQRIESIHASPARGVIAVTGGGSGAIGQLLGVPGASRTVLEAVVPYAWEALAEWVGGAVDSACSEATARAMAMAAMQRARHLAGVHDGEIGEGDDAHLFGVGCTASLASDRPKRGDHRVHVALQTIDRTAVWSLTLKKGARTRPEEEAEAERLVLHAVACAADATDAAPLPVGTGDQLSHREKQAAPLWTEMAFGDGITALINPSANRHDYCDEPRCERVLFPGSFAPPHEGHRRMVEVAERRLGKQVTLELAIANVDKPPLDYLAIDDRLSAIADAFGDHEVWLTRLPTFRRKAQQLGVRVFVVGADTVARIADPKYYGDDPSARDAAIAELAGLGSRFLVFGRVADGRFQTVDDLGLPPALRELCDGVPESEFREDVSSTEVRASRDRGRGG